MFSDSQLIMSYVDGSYKAQNGIVVKYVTEM